MRKTFTAKLKLFMTILLAFTMAFSLVTSVACKKGNNNNSSSSSGSSSTTNVTITERTDKQLVKNGDFEYGTANTKLTEFPIYSSINWTKANDSINGSNAVSSSYTSGIIDTREYKYEYDKDGYVSLDEDGKPIFAKDSNGEKIAAYDAILKNRSSQFDAFRMYEYEYEDDGVTIKTDANGSPIKKVDADGNPVYSFYNPHSPSYYGLTEYKKDEGLTGGGKVLMLNNHSIEFGGAAQYFNSSSDLTLAPGENGKFDIWVLTTGGFDSNTVDYTVMNDVNTPMDDQDLIGAYIQITTTVGSLTAPATRIKNIKTGGEWVKFSIYIEGNDYSQTKLSIRLGLGLGSKTIKQEYAEGYAFFDDVALTVLDKDETLPTSYTFDKVELFGASSELTDKTIKVEGATDYVNRFFNDYTGTIIANPKGESANNQDYKYLCEDNFTTAEFTTITLGIDCSKEETPYNIEGGQVEHLDNLINPSQSDLDKFDKTTSPVISNDSLTFSYDKYANVSYTTSDIEIPGIAQGSDATSDNYVKISFWVKTKLEMNTSGLTVILIDKGTNGTEKPVEVTLKINGSESGNYITKKGVNSKYDDFVKVTVIVSNTYRLNTTDKTAVEARSFALKFVYGPTTQIDAQNLFAFPKGEIIVKDFTKINLSKAEVDSVEKTNDTSVTERMLQADLSNTNSESSSNDTYTFTCGGMVDEIKQNVVSGILNYTGIPGNHNRVVGQGEGETHYTQENTVNGIFNTEFMDNYNDADFSGYKTQIDNWLKTYSTANKYNQPLMINNKVDGLSYGYIGSANKIAVNTTCVITVKVKIFGDATAYIYLADADDMKEFKILGVKAEHTALNQTVSGDYAIALKAEDINTVTGGIGYAEVKFVIRTGSEKALNYRLELWNGERTFAENQNDNKAGIVLFDAFTSSTSDNYDDALIMLEGKYDEEFTNIGTKYSFATAESNKQVFTRLPSTVKTDANPDGEIRTYTEESTAYMTNGFFIVSDLTSIDADSELDERTPKKDTSSDKDENKSEPNYSPWLLFTSLAVAIALIVALLAILVRKLVEIYKKKKASKHSYYDKDSREKAMQNIAKKKNNNDVKFKEEYDYDNIESNIIEDEEVESETEEEVLEEETETTEEAEEGTSTEEATEDAPVQE